MHRRGTFQPSENTSNQCKAEGHPEYHYHLAMVFSSAQALDKNEFIIAHEKIDKLIQKITLKGSCEIMHKKICSRLRGALERKGIELLGSKCRISPTLPNGPAYLEYVYLKDSSIAPILSHL